MSNEPTVAEFLAFCRSKPAGEEYSYRDIDDCAFCQFLRSAGHPVRSVGGFSWLGSDGSYRPIPADIIAVDENDDDVLTKRPWTFGALADRLAALQSVKEG